MAYERYLQGYSFMEILGEGAFGRVYKATHTLTHTEVAVKVMKIDKTVAGLIEREVEALKKVSHPNLAQLYQACSVSGRCFLVQEYCAGKSLRTIISSRREPVIPDDLAASIFAQLTEAVRFLHERLIFHRDIKPDNIILNRSGVVKLIDLGLCAMPADGNSLLTEYNGTRKYSAPEVLQRRPFLGGPADIWSLGITLYNIVTALHPFNAEGKGLAYNAKHKPLVIPEAVSPGCREVLNWILKKDPQLRPSAENILLMEWVHKENIPTAGHEARAQPLVKKAVKRVSKASGLSKEAVKERVIQWDFTYDTASYLIALQELQGAKKEKSSSSWITQFLCGRGC